MKAMKPFYFVHPQYGKLRVVVLGGGTEKSEHHDDEGYENQV